MAFHASFILRCTYHTQTNRKYSCLKVLIPSRSTNISLWTKFLMRNKIHDYVSNMQNKTAYNMQKIVHLICFYFYKSFILIGSIYRHVNIIYITFFPMPIVLTCRKYIVYIVEKEMKCTSSTTSILMQYIVPESILIHTTILIQALIFRQTKKHFRVILLHEFSA